MRKLYKATAVMGGATFVAIITGLVRAKFIAWTLGPSGMGIFSQAMTFFQSAQTIFGLGIGLGITKYVSEAWQNRNVIEIKKTAATFLLLQFISFAILFVIVFIFSQRISQFVFSSAEYSGFLTIMSVAVLFSILIISLESVLLGLAKPDIFSKARIIYYVTGLMLLVLLVGTMKLTGGFFYIVINSIISFTIVCMFLTRILKGKLKISLLDIIKELGRTDFKAYLGKLLPYGAVVLISSTLTWLTILYVRSILIRECGTSSNGFYQVVFALVAYYSPFFTNGLWGYLLPKLSGMDSISGFNAEINKTIRFILLFLTPSIAVLFLLRRVFVLVVFSREFLPALEIFPLYLLGSFFFMVFNVLGTPLLAKKRLNVYLLIHIFQNVVYAGLFMILIRRMGLMAVAISYLTMNIFATLSYGIYQIKRMNFVFNKQNIRLFVIGLTFIVFVFFVPLGLTKDLIIKGPLVALWFLFVMRKREWALLKSFVKFR